MTILCLVRHGQTDWNVQGRWQGRVDQELNSTGLAQASQLANELAAKHFTAIYSSDLGRALTTAMIIAKTHNLPVITHPGLREINMGDWEGKLGIDIPLLYPLEWAERLRSPVGSRPPGGESLIDLSNRVVPAMTELVRRHPDETILVVSHGLALAVFLCHVYSIPLENAFDKIPKNACATWIEWSPTGIHGEQISNKKKMADG